MGKLTQQFLQLLLLPSLLFYAFKCLTWSLPKYDSRERKYVLQKLETEKVLVCHLILWQGGSVLVLRVTLSCITQEGNLALVEYQVTVTSGRFTFFTFWWTWALSLGVSVTNVLADLLCRRIWHAVPAWESCWRWRWIWRALSTIDYWLPPNEDCFEPEQLLNTLSTHRRFRMASTRF